MIASQARIDANRRNAAKSTGPKTLEGKERSRGNGLKHGLCSMTVVSEAAEVVEGRTASFVEALQPADEFQRWAVGQAALLSIRIERCQRMEGCARDKVAIRAEAVWDDDRRLEALRVAGNLAKAPELVVEQLRRTPQGCEWLMSRWAMLANVADSGQGWTEEQAGLALDLMGTPGEFREGTRPVESPSEFARRQIAELVEQQGLVDGLDEVDRALAEADLDDEASPELKRLRRYESALQRRIRWCLDQVGGASVPEALPRVEAEPGRAVVESPPVEPRATPSPIPAATRFANVDLPFGIRPTLDQFVEVPEGPGRPERNLRKAEGRREAKRRKLERLRA